MYHKKEPLMRIFISNADDVTDGFHT